MDISRFTQRLSKGFEHAKQFAAEKMGTAEEVTTFPPEYLTLEEKIDKIKVIYEDLIKVHRQYCQADRYGPGIQEQVVGVFDKLNQQIDKLSSSPKDKSPSPSEQRPPTIQHAAARIALQGAATLQSPTDELSQALSRYGMATDKLGNYRIEMDHKIEHNFLKPIQNIVDAIIGHAIQARKSAQRSRLELDACKSKCKTSKSDRLETLRKDLSDAESQFHAHVDEAIKRMQAVVDNPLVLQCLSELVEAQRKYHQQCYEVLNGLVLQ